MSENSDTKIAIDFISCFSPVDGLIGVLGFPTELRHTDTEYTRAFTCKDGTWKHLDFNFDSRCITSQTIDEIRSWWILGKRGEIVQVTGGVPRHEHIQWVGTGSDKYGYVNHVCAIDSELYVCGYAGQIYKRDCKGKWEQVGTELLSKERPPKRSFECIEGFSTDNIYVAGWHGEIFWFNGSRWVSCEIPTNLAVHSIICSKDRETVYAVGEKGLVLEGSRESWRLIQNDVLVKDLWGVVEFNGKIYVAGFSGIGVVHNGEVREISIEPDRLVQGYRLTSKGKYLWSVSTSSVHRFDGNTWEEVICPG